MRLPSWCQPEDESVGIVRGDEPFVAAPVHGNAIVLHEAGGARAVRETDLRAGKRGLRRRSPAVSRLEGLRGAHLDAAPAGVLVTTALPGVVDTPMITDAERQGGGVVSAADAAAVILRGIERGRAEVWFPRSTSILARLARALPPAIRDIFLRRQPRLEESARMP